MEILRILLLLGRIINILELNFLEYHVSFCFTSPSLYFYCLLCYFLGAGVLMASESFGYDPSSYSCLLTWQVVQNSQWICLASVLELLILQGALIYFNGKYLECSLLLPSDHSEDRAGNNDFLALFHITYTSAITTTTTAIHSTTIKVLGGDVLLDLKIPYKDCIVTLVHFKVTWNSPYVHVTYHRVQV